MKMEVKRAKNKKGPGGECEVAGGQESAETEMSAGSRRGTRAQFAITAALDIATPSPLSSPVPASVPNLSWTPGMPTTSGPRLQYQLEMTPHPGSFPDSSWTLNHFLRSVP